MLMNLHFSDSEGHAHILINVTMSFQSSKHQSPRETRVTLMGREFLASNFARAVKSLKQGGQEIVGKKL
jgi:hypothetical protein